LVKEGLAYGQDSMPLVLTPAQARFVRIALDAQGYTYYRATASGYEVLHKITPRQKDLRLINSKSFKVKANHNRSAVSFAVDGDLTTRWGSGLSQKPGMRFVIKFPQARRIRALSYQLGSWAHDYPRQFKIELESRSRKKKLLFNSKGYQAIRYYLHGNPTMTFFLKKPVRVRKIILTQNGEHPQFDWSIAELGVFE